MQSPDALRTAASNPVVSPFQPERVRRARRAFFDEGVVPDGMVDAAIWRSWRRCQSQGRQDTEAVVFEPVARTALMEILGTHERLLQAACPEIDALAGAVADARCAVLLTDERGRALAVAGQLDRFGKPFRAAFRAGVDLSEETIGTNAMATAMTEQQACRILGPEHYFAATQMFHCYAAPVFDPRGAVVGAVDISREDPGHVPGALELARRCARRIEQAMWAQWPVPVRVCLRAPSVDDAAPGPSRRDDVAWLAFGVDGSLLAADRHAQCLLELSVRELARPLHFGDVFEDEFTPLLGRARRGGGPLALRLHGGVRLLAELGGTAASRPVAMARGAAAAPRLQCDVTAIGADQAYRQRFERTLRAFDAGLPLLVQGETGSGKEVAARALHAASRRRQGSFVALNCAALSPQLMAAELFGHVDGAFTGARRGGQVGHIEAAHGGTLLLDEIGDMPLELQVGLLRVLDRREVVALGDTRARQVDVQFVCATHRDLDGLVRAGRFREDLLHRLRGCVLHVPALRERADIGQLLDRLLSDAGASPDRLPTAVRNRLLAYAWPGNVRELRHAVRLAVAVSGDGDALAWEDFSLGTDAPSQPSAEPSTAGSPATWQQSKSEAAADALRRTGGNMTAAAKLLGIGRATMYRWMGASTPLPRKPMS